MAGINQHTRGRTLVKDKVFFAGGEPRFFLRPRFLRWGPNLSIWWLGTELVVRIG